MPHKNLEDDVEEETTFKTIKMYVSPAEQEELKERARAAHCSLSSYCKHMALFKRPGLDDTETVKAILAAGGNIGKLTGMLKLFLREPKQDVFKKEELKKLILTLQEDRDYLLATAKSMLRRG